MVQFIRKVSDSEQTKRAVLRKTGTALNVILSNCTNSRTCSHRVYGDCIYSTGSQKCRTLAKSENGSPCCCPILKNVYAKQVSNGAGFKNCMVKWMLSKCTMCPSK